MEKIELQDKFVGYVDILGYSALTRAAEHGRHFSFEQLAEIIKMMGTDDDCKTFQDYGPTICPNAPCIQKDLDFQLHQAWDSVVVSVEVSPAGAINLISHCFKVYTRLLTKGVMCRGYIKRGKIYHRGNNILGTGHVDTVEKEKGVSFYKQEDQERGTPFIEIDPEVVDYINDQPDKCVKKMFSRMALTYEGLSAVFPFKTLSGDVSLSDLKKAKKDNDQLRNNIINLKIKVSKLVEGADENVLRKSRHYLRALDKQLEVCDQIDKDLIRLQEPFGHRMTKELFPGLFWDK